MPMRPAGFQVSLTLAIAILAMPSAQAATEVGGVSRAHGSCVGLSDGTSRPLAAGLPVHMDEEITTGEAARLEVTFDEGSVLTLGARARVVIDTFVYRPEAGLDRMLLSSTGPFRLVTGALASPATLIDVRTPAAVIGVRGTDYWAGPIDGVFGVLVLEGVVTVTTNAGAVVLNEPGEGVNLEGIDLPPGPVTQWSADKVDRALATVAF